MFCCTCPRNSTRVVIREWSPYKVDVLKGWLSSEVVLEWFPYGRCPRGEVVQCSCPERCRGNSPRRCVRQLVVRIRCLGIVDFHSSVIESRFIHSSIIHPSIFTFIHFLSSVHSFIHSFSQSVSQSAINYTLFKNNHTNNQTKIFKVL